MYRYYNANALNRFQNDCVIRSISVATNRSWDDVYEHLSDVAQYEGTLMDDGEFVRGYLSKHYEKLDYIPETVGEVSAMYKDNIMLITMSGHITCSKYGVIYDTFDCRERKAENAWIVK